MINYDDDCGLRRHIDHFSVSDFVHSCGQFNIHGSLSSNFRLIVGILSGICLA